MQGPKRALLTLAVLGATVGPLLDGLHTHSGATWYPHPQLWLAEWWVVPLFCGAAVAIGGGRLLTERFLPTRAPTPRQAALSMALFVVGYALSGFWPIGELPMATLLLAFFAVSWAATDRSALGLAAAALTGLGGWLVEHTLVHAGFFFHRDPGRAGVALGIPPLYFCAASALGTLAKQLAGQDPKLKPTTS